MYTTKINLIIFIILTFFVFSCPQTTNTSKNNNIEYCKIAQLHLEKLGCIAKDKPYTKKGKYFGEFCQETISNGIDLSPKCISEITSCDQINPCVQNGK
jgi:hypothetical protein